MGKNNLILCQKSEQTFSTFSRPITKNDFVKTLFTSNSHEGVKMHGVISVVFSRLMCDVRKAEFTHAMHLRHLTSSK